MRQISRHFVYCGHRKVHYRRMGAGPPLLMLHQSPRSSAEYESLIKIWAEHFTIIAPDTPGNGFSAPLWDGFDVWPDMDDFAAASFELLDALGIERCLVYGCHTGSAIAMAMALQNPQRIALAVLDGFAVLLDSERQDFLQNYLPPFTPEWSGAFLAWMWARHREQVVFFPWYKTDNDHRMIYDMSDVSKLNAQIYDIVSAGDYYRHSYRAAFAFDKAAKLSELATEVRIMAAPPDPLFTHLDRLPDVPSSCLVIRSSSKEALLDQALDMFRAAKLSLPDAPPVSPATLTDDLRETYSANGVHYFAASGPPVLVLHDYWQNAAIHLRDLQSLRDAGFGVLAPDLPGHGLSQINAALSLDALRQALLGVDWPARPQLVLSYGDSQAVAAELAATYGCPHIACDAIPASAATRQDLERLYAPQLQETDYGGHLLEAWRISRARQLFWPWFHERRENIIPINDGICPEHIFQLFRALMMTAPEISEVYTQSLKTAVRPDIYILPDWVLRHTGVDVTLTGASHLYEAHTLSARRKALIGAIGRYLS